MSAELKASEANSKRHWDRWKNKAGAVGNMYTALARDAKVAYVSGVNTSFGEVLDDGRIVPMNENLVGLFLEAMRGPYGELFGGRPVNEQMPDDRELFNRLKGLTHEEQMRLIAENKAGGLYSRFQLTENKVTHPVAALGLYPRLTSTGVETDLEVLHSGDEGIDLLPEFAQFAAVLELPTDLAEAETRVFADSGFDTPEHLQDMMVGLAERDLPSALLVVGTGPNQINTVEFVSHTLTPTVDAFSHLQQIARHTLAMQQIPA